MEREGNVSESTLSKSEDKDKSVSSQVLEYYKKYSLSRDLPKYFCGTTSEIKTEEWKEFTRTKPDTWNAFGSIGLDTVKESELVTTGVNTEVFEEKIEPSILQTEHNWTDAPPDQNLCEIPQIHVDLTSPASSITSNRKLEWDNGADIGYSNVTSPKLLQKSISLPVLTTGEYEKLQKTLLNLPIDSNAVQLKGDKSIDVAAGPSCTCSKVFNLPYSSSTSESVKSSKREYLSSSTSEHSIQHQSSASESGSEIKKVDVLKFLTESVGLPIAESTPIIRTEHRKNSSGYCETPTVLKVKEKQEGISVTEDEKQFNKIDLNMVDRISHYKNLKVLKLSIAKPVVVECIGIYEPQEGKNKLIQTTLPRGTSIAVQTDFDFDNSHQLPRSNKYVERQSILYVCHSDSDKDKSIHNSATQTDSDVVSNCNSFEYVFGAEYNEKLNQKSDKQNLRQPECVAKELPGPSNKENLMMDRFLMSNLKRCPPKSDLTTVTPLSDKSMLTSENAQNTSKESPLAQLLSCNQSAHLISDLEIKLNLLQKVVKSKKYDPVTKKYYLKKIVQKMIDTKYVDDSSACDTSRQLSETSDIKTSSKKTSDSDNYQPGSESSTTPPVKNTNLHDNKPWQPVNSHPQTVVPNISQNHLKKRKTPRKLEIKTFTNEILPEPTQYKSKPNEFKISSTNFIPIEVIRDKPNRLRRNQLLTLTDNKLPVPESITKIGDQKTSRDSSNSTANELYEVLQPVNSEAVTSSSNSKISKPSWREDKTRSEQLLEEKACEADSNQENNKDHLISFAKKEREHQLCWINNEISHLNKLKNLLERKKSVDHQEHRALQTILQEPHIEDMKGIKKSTTVYVVTTEKTTVCDFLTCKNPRCPKGSDHLNNKPNRSTNTDPNVRVYEVRPAYLSTASQNVKRCKCGAPIIPNAQSQVRSLPPTICKCAKSSSRPAPTIRKTSNSSDTPVKPPSLVGYGENVVVKPPSIVSYGENVVVKPPSLVSYGENVVVKPPSLVSYGENTIAKPPSLVSYGENAVVKPPSVVDYGENMLEVENQKIDLKNARLVSSEQFTTSNSSNTGKASIRRYTFEIPLDAAATSADDYSCPEEPKQCVRYCPAPCSSDPSKCPDQKEEIISATKTDKVSLSSHSGSVSGSGRRASANLTQQLVNTDEIVNKKGCCNTKCPSPPCRSPKSSKISNKQSESSSSSSSESESAESSTDNLCSCCKQQPVKKSKRSKSGNSEKYILCVPCYNQHQTVGCGGSKPYYTVPGHVCNCYDRLREETVQKIKDTIKELDSLEKEEEQCKCKIKKKHLNSGYCERCKCKLKKKHKSKKGGLAYTLTLESDSEVHKKKKKAKRRSLPEIKIKVESPRNKKKKDQNIESTDCYSPEEKSSEDSTKENESYDYSVKSKVSKMGKHKKPTLQEYLCANKPNFVSSAEQRRQALLDLAYMREQRCQKYKQLLALTKDLPMPQSSVSSTKSRMFDPKEMQAVTAKKYKKLPEVQQKLLDNREKQIRKANKLLSNIFNEKLRQQVLKGRHTLPPDTSIISLVS